MGGGVGGGDDKKGEGIYVIKVCSWPENNKKWEKQFIFHEILKVNAWTRASFDLKAR